MKIAFISDIHGNAIALEAVLNDIKQNKVDKIYVLGDLCYRGPEPRRSLDLIRSLNTEVIKGNADEWVVRGVREGEVPQKVIDLMNIERDWTYSKLEPSDLAYLETLPTEINCEVSGTRINAFHATPGSLFEIVLPNEDDAGLQNRLMSSQDAQIYVYAHIHKAYIRHLNGKILMNVGSVGLPFDGITKASYGLIEIEEGKIKTSIQRVDFDAERVIQLYRDVDYPNAEMMSGIVRNARV
ncbi:metallophosphoesterase family protein [Paenibacillus sp. WC2504]|uniref:metallophosphoesterase family protein n=1 Tax=Paenibacillus sp. WC2504 TaxID=3461403 RepID=UPI004045E2D4